MNQNFSWRQHILNDFKSEATSDNQLTVVVDRGGFFTEQKLVDELNQRHFEILFFDDSVSFRYIYEEKYRKLWEQGSKTQLIVVTRSGLESIPFDIFNKSQYQNRQIEYDIGDLFPKLAPVVLSEIDRSDLDRIFEVQKSVTNSLGVNATQDFILKYVFEIQPELISTPDKLLAVLLQHHYRKGNLPSGIRNRLVFLLNQNAKWAEWDLELLFSSRNMFYHFMQERWPIFVRKYLAERGRPISSEEIPGFTVKGPSLLPFDHESVKIYIDTLFMEGLLRPVLCSDDALTNSWISIGTVSSDPKNDVKRFEYLLNSIIDKTPGEKSKYIDWLDFSRNWGEVRALYWSLNYFSNGEIAEKTQSARNTIETKFTSWMLSNFSSLSNLSYANQPVTVNQVVHYLHGKFEIKSKIALLVVDGMAISQWLLLKEHLKSFSVEEKFLFAWVPTLTSVSRQSIFSGKIPFLFSQSIRTSQKDEAQWLQFWEDKGMQRQEISYLCQKQNEIEGVFFERILEKIEHPKTKALGLVVGTIDQSAHAIVTDSGGLLDVVSGWAKRGFFSKLVQSLVENQFEVFITSDHGNVAVDGMGRPNVGSIADDRGERVYTFQDESMRDQTHRNFPGSIAWPQIGLPSDYWCLLAPQGKAFFERGKHAISHGGISIEEVIVPFVRVQKY